MYLWATEFRHDYHIALNLNVAFCSFIHLIYTYLKQGSDIFVVKNNLKEDFNSIQLDQNTDIIKTRLNQRNASSLNIVKGLGDFFFFFQK